jgi:hypothetical protein
MLNKTTRKMLNKTTPTMKSLRHAAASKSTIFWMADSKNVKQDDSNYEVAASRCGEQIDLSAR